MFSTNLHRLFAPFVSRRPTRRRAGASFRGERLEERAVLAAVDQLRLTEIAYNPLPATQAELDQGFVDLSAFEFLELYNVSTEPLIMDGLNFSGGITFGLSGEIAPGEIVIVARDPAAFQFRHGNVARVLGPYRGRLNDNGELVTLLDGIDPVFSFTFFDGGFWPSRADGRGSSLEFFDLDDDYSDPDNWRASAQYLGSPGHLSPDPVTRVVINEVLAHTDPPDKDSIELLNPTNAAVDISGWYLSDSTDFRKFRIPNGTILPAGGYVVFDEDDFNPGGRTGPDDFVLNSAHGEDLYLTSINAQGNLDRFEDFTQFTGTFNGVSLGRWPNAVGELFPMTSLTLAGPNAGPRTPKVLISEIYYNSAEPAGADDLEFVEISNTLATPVNLTNWRIRGGVDFDFPPDLILNPLESIVLLSFDPDKLDPLGMPENAARAAAFRAAHGIGESVRLLGGFSDKLDNTKDRIELEEWDQPPDDEPDFIPRVLHDRVLYDDDPPWPADADGRGDSIKRRTAAAYGNFDTSWRGSLPTPGSFTADPATLQALEVRPFDWGVALDFDRTLAESPLNLYDGRDIDARSDFSIVGQTVGPVAGSVRWNPLRQRLEFLKTGAPLAPDLYTLTLSGDADGIQTTAGQPLDGNRDGTPGGDFSTTFRVQPTTTRTLSLPDFVRGRRQSVNLAGTGGIPLSISDGEGVVEVDLRLSYDPAQLTISSATLAAGIPGDWQIDRIDATVPGRLELEMIGTTPLAAGPRTLVVLAAQIPATAPQGQPQPIRFERFDVNDGAIPARADDGVQAAALLGDASGNGTYSGFDAALLYRVSLGLDAGLDAFPRLDPRIVGAIDNLPSLSLDDAILVARKAVGLAVPEIPDVPSPAPPPSELAPPALDAYALQALQPRHERRIDAIFGEFGDVDA